MTLLSFADLKPLKGIPYCDDHIRRLVKDRKFPAPIKLGPRTNAWIEAEIDAWVQARAADREALTSA